MVNLRSRQGHHTIRYEEVSHQPWARDLNELRRLYPQFKALHKDLKSSHPFEWSEDEFLKWVGEVWHIQTACLVVAFDGNHLIGHGIANIDSLTFRGKIANFDEIVVLEKYQNGKGVGSQILQILTMFAESKGAKVIKLTSHPDKEAGPFYVGKGFKKTNSDGYVKHL